MNNSHSHQQLHNKSSETVDEIVLTESKRKESSMSLRRRSNLSLNNPTGLKVKSANTSTNGDNEPVNITNTIPNIAMQTVEAVIEIKNNSDELNAKIEVENKVYASVSQAKFEKKLIKSAKTELNSSADSRMNNKAIMANTTYLTNRVKSVSSNQYLNQYNRSSLLNKRDKSNESSKISNAVPIVNDEPVEVYYSHKNIKSPGDFKINFGVQVETSPKPVVNDEPNLDYIDPNNIMSDPVIMEQFRKLYEEDEYFQQVHKKCCQWLLRYVIPEMEAQKSQKTNNNQSMND